MLFNQIVWLFCYDESTCNSHKEQPSVNKVVSCLILILTQLIWQDVMLLLIWPLWMSCVFLKIKTKSHQFGLFSTKQFPDDPKTEKVFEG